MVRRTKEDAQETRALILDTAEQVFRDKGVGHTTLAEIANAAGLSRGAIYWHFDNKAALLQAMNDRVHLPLEAMHQALAEKGLPDPLAKVRASARAVLTQVTEDPRTRRVFEILTYKCEFVGEMADMLARELENRRNCLCDIEESLRQAVEKGQLPATVNTREAAIGIYALVDGLIKSWLLDPEGLDLQGVGDRLITGFCQGLASPR